MQNGRDIPLTSRKVVPSDPDFKEVVFMRSFSACNYKPGMRVKVRKAQKMRGVINEIIDRPEEVKWERNLPHFIVVEMDSGDTIIANPGQIKRCK